MERHTYILEITISIGMEKSRKTRLVLLKTVISNVKLLSLLLTFGSKSEAAATSIAIPDVNSLYVSLVY